MAIPKENRQQMINLMYLVLMALLALNVSAELLNAFSLINNSLNNSAKSLDGRNESVYKSFTAKKVKEPANQDLIKFEAAALEMKQKSAELQTYVDQLINDLITEGGGIDPVTGDMARRDDVSLSTRFLVEGTERGSVTSGRGYDLKKKIDAAIVEMTKNVKKEDLAKELADLPVSTKARKEGADWVRETFAQIPAIASQTMLIKIKSDIKAAEGQLATYFFRQVGDAKELAKDEIVFDKFGAKIVAPSSYIMQGDAFEAEVFLAAFNSKTNNVSINVNGSSLPVNSDGVAKYSVRGNSPGEYPVRGTITVRNERTGQNNSYPLPDFKYTVAAPFANVTPTKMNVFYIGVPNPVLVSAAGYRQQDLSVSMSAGTISSEGNGYVVRVQSQGETNVNVSAKGKQLASVKFRVKMIPDPKAKVGNKEGGSMNAAEMKVQNGLAAVLENFDFDAKFDVISYNVTYLARRQDPTTAACTGPYFSQAVKGFQSQMKPGDTIYFEEIRVKGPDGTTRKIPSIVFKLI